VNYLIPPQNVDTVGFDSALCRIWYVALTKLLLGVKTDAKLNTKKDAWDKPSGYGAHTA
jgi:hypothetical protein